MYNRFIIVLALISSATALYGDLKVNLVTGISIPGDSFSQELQPAHLYGIEADFRPAFLRSYNPRLAVHGNFQMAQWPLTGSKDSSLDMKSFMMGGRYLWEYRPLVSLFGGAGLSTDRIVFQGSLSGESAKYWKNGYYYEGGMLIYSASGIGVTMAAMWHRVKLSSDNLDTLDFKTGLTLNTDRIFYLLSRPGTALEQEQHRDRIDMLLNQGQEAFRSRNIAEAKGYFQKVLNIQDDEALALRYMEQIRWLEDSHRQAEVLIGQGYELQAIPLLQETAPFMRESQQLLVTTRRKLQGSIPQWQNRGISSFERNDYDSCIYYMKRILLVDPANERAKLYLHKAITRKQAIEKLE